MTSIAEPRAAGGVSSLRLVLVLLALGLLALQTPPPWGALWLLVPVAFAVSLLAAWRFGAWALAVPAAGFAVAFLREGLGGLSSWWIPVAGLSGVWMGLREEGEGPSGGERAWMMLPLLALAAGLPFTLHYPALIEHLNRELHAADPVMLDFCRRLGFEGDRLNALERAMAESAALRRDALPLMVPSLLFGWMIVLVAAGRTLCARVAGLLRWPALSRARLRDWRLPDGAIWVFLAGLALLVAQWKTWAPTAWTLLINSLLGFCVQGIAVVESLLLARGVPPSIIALSMLFVFVFATPVFALTTAAVGVSDVWLDFRRLEPAADQE